MFADGFDAFWALQTPIWVLRALEPDLCPKYQFARARAVGLRPSNLPSGGFGDLAVFGRFGVKNEPKKSFQMCLGILGGGIYDVFGWF